MSSNLVAVFKVAEPINVYLPLQSIAYVHTIKYLTKAYEQEKPYGINVTTKEGGVIATASFDEEDLLFSREEIAGILLGVSLLSEKRGNYNYVLRKIDQELVKGIVTVKSFDTHVNIREL